MKNFSSIDKILSKFGYPENSVIVKSRYGIGGRGVYLLLGNQKKELKISIDSKKKLIEEVSNIIESNKISENSKRLKIIQEEWKKIGYLPRKISNSLWNEFKPLVNKYYNILKSGDMNLADEEQEIFDKKSKFIDKIKFSKMFIKKNGKFYSFRLL